MAEGRGRVNAEGACCDDAARIDRLGCLARLCFEGVYHPCRDAAGQQKTSNGERRKVVIDEYADPQGRLFHRAGSVAGRQAPGAD